MTGWSGSSARGRSSTTVPVLIVTARADDALRIQLLRDGAQDYLMKPFVVEEVRARVANLVAMKRTREVLQAEVQGQTRDLAGLAGEVALRKREVEAALELDAAGARGRGAGERGEDELPPARLARAPDPAHVGEPPAPAAHARHRLAALGAAEARRSAAPDSA